jgi:RNA polymerase sigma-70 factor (ECF subfamily)
MSGDKLSAEDATRHLVELYRHDVFKYARYMLGSVIEAEDATQEIFTRVYQSWDRFAQLSQAQTWMWSIARNHIYDLLRKKKRESRLLDRRTSAELSNIPSRESSLFELEDAIQGLRPAYRQVLILRYIQDKSISETATLLGWTESKVKVTAFRALKELREVLNSSGTIRSPQSAKRGDSNGI